MSFIINVSLQWLYNGRDVVSNQQRLCHLLNCLGQIRLGEDNKLRNTQNWKGCNKLIGGQASANFSLNISWTNHYIDVIMSAMASQIPSVSIRWFVQPFVQADQRQHQSSASLAFMRGIQRWPVNSPHKWQVTRKMFPFDDVIIEAIQSDIDSFDTTKRAAFYEICN